MSISVICVTNRLGAVEYLKGQLDKQTFKDFEVIVADDSGGNTVFEKQFIPRPKNAGDVWNINKAYNDALDRVDGELIVFLQDFIWIPANGLQRFWDMYGLFKNDLITGCGHKYTANLKTIVEVDDRALEKGTFKKCHWSFYELNWASCPTRIAQRFEEDMDTHYGGENQIFALKAYLGGAHVYVDSMNECKGLSQDMCGGRPSQWEERHANKGFLNQKIWSIHQRHLNK